MVMKKKVVNHDHEQNQRNESLLSTAKYLGPKVESQVIPFQVDIEKTDSLTDKQVTGLQALEISAARTAIETLASLAEINELDHLGGALDLISAFTLTMAIVDYEKKEYTIENAHSSIGHYSVLAAYGYLDKEYVIKNFRRSLDIAGHVAWLPGGTQSNGGRLGVMVPVAVGQALGKRAVYGEGSWMLVHCGDAGWISGQALNGFNAADLHKAPITFIMHRNGVQLSGSCKQIMPKDPRPVIASLGIQILEIPSLHDVVLLYQAYREAYQLSKQGKAVLIFPAGFYTSGNKKINLLQFGEQYGILKETEQFAQKQGVLMSTPIWIPGSLMSYRDVEPMLECLFLVNDLPGGKGHHDGHMKGRKLSEVLGNPMLQYTLEQHHFLQEITKQPLRKVVTEARPAPGSENLILTDDVLAKIKLANPGEKVSPRVGVDLAYTAVAQLYPDHVFIVGCDLDTSTRLEKARKYLKANHHFEMSIEEQASALMASGLAISTRQKQLNVFSTFAAFFEGIAREGFELWRYQRNLNGINEGLNVTLHLSHVGACTGRDHFSGWSLDWINLAIGYLPYLHRFYAPADAWAAFVAVKDLAAHYGGHIIGVPRDNLPVLAKQDSSGALWEATSSWEAVTAFRKYPGAQRAVLVVGAPAFLAERAADELQQNKIPTDVFIINGLPIPDPVLHNIFKNYRKGLVTVEDGIIGTAATGRRGFAGLISAAAYPTHIPLQHIGISDPRIAPSHGLEEVWEHFGITKQAIIQAVKDL
jgi:transketolase N-terminal domain/subunit/transketolase C-terminal domain/subunit